jgi:hypothetical protein
MDIVHRMSAPSGYLRFVANRNSHASPIDVRSSPEARVVASPPTVLSKLEGQIDTPIFQAKGKAWELRDRAVKLLHDHPDRRPDVEAWFATARIALSTVELGGMVARDLVLPVDIETDYAERVAADRRLDATLDDVMSDLGNGVG